MGTEDKIKDAKAVELVTGMVANILDGTITEEALGTVLKTLQIQMAASLIINQDKTVAVVNRIAKASESLLEKFEECFKEEVEKITDASTALDWIERINKMQLNTLEVQRKIVQGKELFNTTTMSNEEKMISRLLTSFSSKEDKVKFMKIVEDQLSANVIDNGFEE